MADRDSDSREPAEPGLVNLSSIGARKLARLIRSTTPAVTAGLPLTLLLAFVAGAGRIVTALTVQYALDHGLLTPRRGDTDVVAHAVLVGAAAHRRGNTRLLVAQPAALPPHGDRPRRAAHGGHRPHPRDRPGNVRGTLRR